jgi:hypothetical protein
MRTNVYLTVDTEHSMGGAWGNAALRPVPAERHIYCHIGGKDNGIGWICDELERHKFRATFFAEVFCSLVFGVDATRSWCQYLLEHGQDVQLHTHLNYYYYAKKQVSPVAASEPTDDIARLPQPLRTELLEQAYRIFYSLTGYAPAAFRAGNWVANRAFLSDLANLGIRLDCSFNPAVADSFPGEALALNVLQKINGTWELPLSAVRQRLPEPHLARGVRPFDLVSLSSWEICKTLDESWKKSTPHVAAVLHSFSGVKTKDVQYEQIKPNRVVRGRVRSFLDYLAARSDRFRVRTLSELASELDDAQPTAPVELPNLGFIHPLARKVVQAVNTMYWV